VGHFVPEALQEGVFEAVVKLLRALEWNREAIRREKYD